MSVPSFVVDGDPGRIRARATLAREKAGVFTSTADALAKVSTGGWSGRAAERFRDALDTEPDRWRDAGTGFLTAAQALLSYADALESAQLRAQWARGEYERGEQVTGQARAAYDADVSQARREVAQAAAQGEHVTLTILPFTDPGGAVRDGALAELASARADLAAAGQVCATEVRAGCAAAPEERRWWESGLAAVGGFLQGAGEATWDLLTLPGSPISLLQDSMALATGRLTPEEMAARYRMGVEQVGDMVTALREDPAEFGKTLGKAVLDWDTWADDPARALGHLVPDAVAAVVTAGAGAVATRGVKGTADVVDALGDLSTTGNRLDDVGDLGRLDDAGGLGRFDDVGGHVPLDDLPGWTDGKDVPRTGPDADLYPDGLQRYGPLDRQEFYDRYWDPADGASGSWRYPADEGFAAPPRPNTIEPGDVLDRLGRPGGSYASPEGTPYAERALPPSSVGADYHRYEVLRPLPDTVTEGPIAPWFEQPGGGLQYKFDETIDWYIEHGYLRKIE
ncbi:TNT domain-containing protein [Georgenia faecalis]|uniref:TNT domain-containing protein n=1 Tax=Georgenia faecalis TaxID=2483799 RepID=UPI000FDBA9AD|nr:TNT domain-containing protein [Georgenia faecalis]